MWQPTTHWAEIFPDVALISRKATLRTASLPSSGRETVECRGLLGVNTSANAWVRHGFGLQCPKRARPASDPAPRRQCKDSSTLLVALPRRSRGFPAAWLSPQPPESNPWAAPARMLASGVPGPPCRPSIRGSRIVVAQACGATPRRQGGFSAGGGTLVKRADPVPAPVRGWYRVRDVDA